MKQDIPKSGWMVRCWESEEWHKLSVYDKWLLCFSDVATSQPATPLNTQFSTAFLTASPMKNADIYTTFPSMVKTPSKCIDWNKFHWVVVFILVESLREWKRKSWVQMPWIWRNSYRISRCMVLLKQLKIKLQTSFLLCCCENMAEGEALMVGISTTI